MRKASLPFLLIILVVFGTGCKFFKKNKSSVLPDDGQLYGVAPGAKGNLKMPVGMAYIPPGTFHMGPSDEDISYALTARNRQVTIPGFWMDKTEVTNNKYRQFVFWVRDSMTYKVLFGQGLNNDGDTAAVDWKKVKTIKYDNATLSRLDMLTLSSVDRLYGKNELDPQKLEYRVEYFDLQKAAKRGNAGKPRSNFMVKYNQKVYPDTLVWMRDFSYAYNEPMTKRYFSHPSFGNYPVVGVNWKQAVAFSHWRTRYLNSFLEKKGMAADGDFRLPSEAEWEYAARGGRTNSMYGWGNYYVRNKKGCLLANFKPGRGNYAEDGGVYTVRADAYWPNDYGLYNMSGNVAEWTGDLFYEGAYNFIHDMSPSVRIDADDSADPLDKRKVVRGGSWKDVAYYLKVSTRTYEYQDTAKSYIGFRNVIDLSPRMKK